MSIDFATDCRPGSFSRVFDRPRRQEAANHHLRSSSHKNKTITITIPMPSMLFMTPPFALLLI
jgi:hypothetical protein